MDERLAPAWKPAEAILAILVVFGLAGVLSVPIFLLVRSEATELLLGAVSFGVALLAVPLLWVRFLHHQPLSALGLSSRRPARDLLAGAGAGLALFLLTVIVVAPAIYALITLFTGDQVTPPDQPILPEEPNGRQVALGAVAAIVAAPVAEEVFFRGFLFGALRRRLRFPGAAAVSGAVFGAFHVIPLLIPLMIFVGVGLAYIYERRGSLLASIAAHSIFNVIGYTLIVRSIT
ncbi:MAG TPA: type II CAAX endopeptidase family protein [Actinomycetota bacterium]|jgi:membrane protease YdiL (CAAX protease family)|nr:type II CAAX endopeptidase family protein [Actinomycetota bacterium]